MSSVETRVTIAAPPAVVGRFLVEPERFLGWMTFLPGAPPSAGSAFEPRPGGALRIVFPNGAEAHGSVVAVETERRLAFTWGYAPDVGSTGLGPGASTVELTLRPAPEGTVVTVTHTGPMSDAVAAAHVPGWRHYLSQLALQAADAHHGAHAAARLADYAAAWSEPDAAARAALLERCCTSDVRVRSRFTCADSLAELDAAIANGLRHMAGAVTTLDGPVRHLHGAARAPWAVRMADRVVARGEHVARLAPDGRIADVVTFPAE